MLERAEKTSGAKISLTLREVCITSLFSLSLSAQASANPSKLATKILGKDRKKEK